MLTLLHLVACKPEPPVIPVFAPTAVGFGFDGAVRANGQLSAYSVGPDEFSAVLVMRFVSDAWFETDDDNVRAVESCVAIAGFEPPALVEPAQIPTVDDAPLFVSYDATLSLSASSCGADPTVDGDGRADPELWGEHGQDLTDPFEGAHIGLGLGPMTDVLREAWEPDVLADVGTSMLASWIAVNDAEGAWIAGDWTTAVAFDWDPVTGQLVTQLDGEGRLEMVPLPVDTLTFDDPLPPMYIQPYPSWYQDFSLMDFENLGL